MRTVNNKLCFAIKRLFLLSLMLLCGYLSKASSYLFPHKYDTTISGAGLNIILNPITLTLVSTNLNTFSTIDYCPPDPDIMRFNLCVKASMTGTSNTYNYGKNSNWHVDFNVLPTIWEYVSSLNTFNDIDVNPFNSTMDNSFNIYLDHTKPEAVYKMEINSSSTTGFMGGFNILSLLKDHNHKLRFGINGTNYYGINLADIKVEFYIEPLDVNYTGEYNTAALTLPCLGIPINHPLYKPNGNNNPVNFVWKYCDAALFELQVLRLYNTDPNKHTEQEIVIRPQDIDWSKAFTMYCPQGSQSQNLTLAEGSGFYLWRVRPINDVAPGGEANPDNWLPWSPTPSITNGMTTINETLTDCDPSIFYYTQFDYHKNWIYNCHLIEAEEQLNGLSPNLIGEGMTYANGLGMTRQTQSKSNSNNEVVASNSYQDFVGRTALTTLAAATGETKLGYLGNLGGTFGPDDFDKDINYFNPAPMPAAPGTISGYYSDLNSDLGVPNADNYPYTRTRFQRNPLSIAVENSMAGKTLKIGGEPAIPPPDNPGIHTTRIMLGSVSDPELIRIFGDEAPASKSVIKQINIDPNATISVSYTDKSGKTLATCLSKPVSGLLDAIPSDPPFITTFLVDSNIQQYTKDGEYIMASQTLSFAEPTSITFDYRILIKKYFDECADICKTCDYDVELTLTSEENPDSIIWHNYFQIDPNDKTCSEVNSNTNQLYDQKPLSQPSPPTTPTLPAGTYYVKKILRPRSINTATGKTYFEEAEEELENNLNEIILNPSHSMNNWKVLDGDNLNNPNFPIPNINIDILQEKLNNKIMLGPGGVYDMLGIDPYADSLFNRLIILDNSSCKDTLHLFIQACADADCRNSDSFAYKLIKVFKKSMMDSLLVTSSVPDDTNRLFLLNNMLFSTLGISPNSIPPLTPPTLDHHANKGQYSIYLSDEEVVTIIKNMLNEIPDFNYTCENLQNAWSSSIIAYIAQLKNNNTGKSENEGDIFTSQPDFLDMFFTKAGYHFTCGTDDMGSGSSIGYITHPYRCFYYPEPGSALKAYVDNALATSNGKPAPDVMAILYYNNHLNPNPSCSPPIPPASNDIYNNNPTGNFDPNFQNTNYPVAPCDKQEKTLLAFFKNIQNVSDNDQLKALLPFSIDPFNVDEAMYFITEAEENCKKNLCEAKRSLFREQVSESLIEGTFNQVEGFKNSPLSPVNFYCNNINICAANWADVHVEMIMENCKNKCLTHVVKIKSLLPPYDDSTVYFPPEYLPELVKPLSYELKLYRNHFTNYTSNGLCNTCYDQLSGGNCVINPQAVANTVMGQSATYPLPNIDGELYAGCCPTADTTQYPDYPIVNADIDHPDNMNRVFMMNSDRTYSALYLALPWLQKQMARRKVDLGSGANSTLPWDLYDEVFNYFNPVSYPGDCCGYSTFAADENNNNDELKSDPGTSRSKTVTLDNNKTAFFNVGLRDSTTTLLMANDGSGLIYSGYTMKRYFNQVLPLHAKMRVEILVYKTASTYPDRTIRIEEVLKDYGNIPNGPNGNAPLLKFVSDRSNMIAQREFHQMKDTLKLVYDVSIAKDNSLNTWAICNNTFNEAYKQPINSGGPLPNGATEANLCYSTTTVKVNGVQYLPDFNSKVSLPLFHTYNYWLNQSPVDPSSLLSTTDETPDILIRCPYNGAYNCGNDSLLINHIIQPVPLYFCHYKSDGTLIQDKLWDINNYKVYWQNLFCLQWIPIEYPQVYPQKEESCADHVAKVTFQQLWKNIDDIIQKRKANFARSYFDSCVYYSALKDSFTASFQLNYHHYTLYYYNRAGNLVRTVPPLGVSKQWCVDRNCAPLHTMVTEYDYNSLNQLVKQTTPDGGSTEFFYDAIGRMRFSQNAKQKPLGKYSYTKYDALGRIIEVGEAPILATLIPVKINDNSYPDALVARKDVVYTTYTTQYFNGALPLKYCSTNEAQQNLLLRVSYTISKEDPNLNSVMDQVITVYSYDPHGNVKWLAQRVADMPFVFVKYEYDLISGSVKKVSYNECDYDAFFHLYTYDTDKRLVKVETSRDEKQWDKDAKYAYYKHGPLKSMTIGQDELQQVDYAYTINGWLKGMNHPSRENPGNQFPQFDMKDIYASKLHYFKKDYNRSYTDQTTLVTTQSAFNDIDDYGYNTVPDPANTHTNLYNGNIPQIITSIHNPKLDLPLPPVPEYLYANQYRYDELNRITKSNYMQNIVLNTMEAKPQFNESFDYDANGNILHASRTGPADIIPGLIDNFTYNYKTVPNGTNPPKKLNQLDYVTDSAPLNTLPSDYDIKGVTNTEPEQTINNYTYDKIGNLTSDVQEKITEIQWNVFGKIRKIIKQNGLTISYLYDASGNRVLKSLYANNSTYPQNREYYLRDASGNIMSTYKQTMTSPNGTYTLKAYDQPIYGSSRLGTHVSGATRNGNVNNQQMLFLTYPNFDNILKSSRLIGKRMMDYKRYELSDHLGNVRATFSDIRKSLLNGSGQTGPYTFSAFEPDQKSMYNLYAFGMPKFGDAEYYQSNDNPASIVGDYKYKFGFNGQEKDDEINGPGNLNSAMFWEYDTRLGRRWNIDPKPSVGISDYSCFSNNPVILSDPLGDTDSSKETKSPSKKEENKSVKKVDPNLKLNLEPLKLNNDKTSVIPSLTIEQELEKPEVLAKVRQRKENKENAEAAAKSQGTLTDPLSLKSIVERQASSGGNDPAEYAKEWIEGMETTKDKPAEKAAFIVYMVLKGPTLIDIKEKTNTPTGTYAIPPKMPTIQEIVNNPPQ